MSHVAQRLKRINVSQSVAVAEKARHLRACGRDIINLSIGEPDFETPYPIRQAAIHAIEQGQTRYTDVSGTPALRQVIADTFRRDSGIAYNPDEIMVSTGGKQVIFNAMLASLDPGDEVIIPTPCWVSYPDIVTLAEGVPVFVPCKREDGFRLTADTLEAAITPRTKWLIVNNPCNPSGAAYSAAELQPLCDVLLRHPQVWVLTDDIYDKLVYDGFEIATFVQVEPALRERTITMNGCSKTYAMTGWRVGYAGGPASLIRAMDKLQGQSTTNASSISQAAAIKALSGDQGFIKEMVNTYQERRDLVVDLLNQAPGLVCDTPQGAFYAFPSMQGCLGRTSRSGVRIDNDEAFVTALLEEQGVAAIHGAAYFFQGHFRVSYATDSNSLRQACKRIHEFCNSLS